MNEFPTVHFLSEIKKWKIYKLDKPLKENSNARLQIRNWVENASTGKYSSKSEKRSSNNKPLTHEQKMQRIKRYGDRRF